MFSKIALVTVIENNTDNKNGHKYFDEAIKCYKSWRKHHPDIKIYAICVSDATLSKKEQTLLKKLNVQYIEKYFPETEDFEYGFYNVPLALKYFETLETNEKIIIHTDLDMYLEKPINTNIFSPIFENKIIIGKYDENARKDQRVDYDTGFTIHLKNTKFYHIFWSIVKQLIDKEIPLPKSVKTYDLEEYAITLVENNNLFNISPIMKYQVGEGYPSIDTFSDEEVENIYFWHEHLESDTLEENLKEKIKYYKRR